MCGLLFFLKIHEVPKTTFSETSRVDCNFLVFFQAFFRSTDIWSFMLRAKMLVRTRQAVAVGHHRSAHQIKGTFARAFRMQPQCND